MLERGDKILYEQYRTSLISALAAACFAGVRDDARPTLAEDAFKGTARRSLTFRLRFWYIPFDHIIDENITISQFRWLLTAASSDHSLYLWNDSQYCDVLLKISDIYTNVHVDAQVKDNAMNISHHVYVICTWNLYILV